MLLNAQFAFADSLKIGVVDLQEILMRAPQMQQINTRLQQEYESRQQEVTSLEETLQQEQQRLYREEATMSQAERTQVEGRIQMTQRELQRKQEDYQQDLTLRQNQEMSQLVEQVKTEISAIAANEDFDLILQKDMLPFANDKFDITQEVIEKLSKNDDND